jgi:hypothetical protein
MAAQPAQPQRQSQGPPSTSSLVWAEWRRGLKDLQNIVLNPWQGYAATHEEPGTIANPTNIEVYKQRHEESYHPRASVRGEVSVQSQSSVRSPADLIERHGAGQQQQGRQEVSPADLGERDSSKQGQGQHHDASPADLSEGAGPAAHQEGQQESKGQGISM